MFRTDELKESDVGTGAGVFYVDKIGDEYYTFIVGCKEPKACTLLLRGASKDVLNEIERNLQDAMNVARNVVFDPRLLPGGGATEMAVAVALTERAKSIDGIQQWPYRGVAEALEVIPRTLIQNCGAPVVRVLTQLRAKHASGPGNTSWGVDGEKGVIVDMKELGVWEPLAVKVQTFKTAVEAACLLLRVDDILSGLSNKKDGNEGPSQAEQNEVRAGEGPGAPHGARPPGPNADTRFLERVARRGIINDRWAHSLALRPYRSGESRGHIHDPCSVQREGRGKKNR